jgi:serine/threonine-protein phosphatase with EF-hand domain
MSVDITRTVIATQNCLICYVGYLTLDEFEEACTVVSHHTEVNFPPNYAHDLANSMDLDKDGRICFNEFLECFRIVDNEEKGISPRRGNIENSTV